MEKIQLEVDKLTAEKWNSSNRKTKKQISDAFEKVLDIFFENKEDDFWPFLEGIRKKAENKGFNDEILDKILDDK